MDVTGGEEARPGDEHVCMVRTVERPERPERPDHKHKRLGSGYGGGASARSAGSRSGTSMSRCASGAIIASSSSLRVVTRR